MSKERSTPIDRQKERAVAFAEWIGAFYIKLHGGWVQIYANQIKAKIKTTSELYDEFLTKGL
jgi:hypothetical protein